MLRDFYAACVDQGIGAIGRDNVWVPADSAGVQLQYSGLRREARQHPTDDPRGGRRRHGRLNSGAGKNGTNIILLMVEQMRGRNKDAHAVADKDAGKVWMRALHKCQQRGQPIKENGKLGHKSADAVGSSMAPMIYGEDGNLVLAKTFGDMIVAAEVLCIAMGEQNDGTRRFWHPTLIKQLVPGGA
jgi:hypothetical protein